MNESVVVGLLIIAASLGLAVREVRTQAQATGVDLLIQTPLRHVRRLAISAILAVLGALILATGTHWLPLEPRPDGTIRLANLIIFVVGGLLLSVVLMVLAYLDFRESTRLLARQAIHEWLEDPSNDTTDGLAGDLPSNFEDGRPIPTTKSGNRIPKAPDSPQN